MNNAKRVRLHKVLFNNNCRIESNSHSISSSNKELTYPAYYIISYTNPNKNYQGKIVLYKAENLRGVFL